MKKEQRIALLAAAFALQEESGDVFDITTDRTTAIGEGASATVEEIAVLLASPLARQEELEHRHARKLRLAEIWHRQVANDRGATVLALGQAADSGLIQEPALHCSAGTLEVRRGPSTAVPFILVLRLDPKWWDHQHGLIKVAVREIAPDGLIWLEGTTDRDGVLRSQWQHPASLGTPAERLRDLLAQDGTMGLDGAISIVMRP